MINDLDVTLLVFLRLGLTFRDAVVMRREADHTPR